MSFKCWKFIYLKTNDFYDGFKIKTKLETEFAWAVVELELLMRSATKDEFKCEFDERLKFKRSKYEKSYNILIYTCKLENECLFFWQITWIPL